MEDATLGDSGSTQLVPLFKLHQSGDGMRPDRQVDTEPLLAYLKSLSSTSLVLYKLKSLPYNTTGNIYGLLDQLISESVVPAATLEEILSLALIPHNLYGFEDSRVISATMNLLRSHYQETSVSNLYVFQLLSEC
jgi:hypothetical protein